MTKSAPARSVANRGIEPCDRINISPRGLAAPFDNDGDIEGGIPLSTWYVVSKVCALRSPPSRRSARTPLSLQRCGGEGIGDEEGAHDLPHVVLSEGMMPFAQGAAGAKKTSAGVRYLRAWCGRSQELARPLVMTAGAQSTVRLGYSPA